MNKSGAHAKSPEKKPSQWAVQGVFLCGAQAREWVGLVPAIEGLTGLTRDKLPPRDPRDTLYPDVTSLIVRFMLIPDLIRSTVALALLALGLGLSPPVVAENPEEAAANLLYTDGKAAFDAGRYAAALTLFQQAYEVLQNDFIRFNLGRTHAALGQCEKALSHFDELKTRLPPGPRELRRVDEVSCRLRLAAGHLDGFRCHEALETLAPIDRRVRSPDERRRFAALRGTATQCTDVFGTRTAIGQKAARLYAEALTALRASHSTRALALAQESLAAKPSRPAASVEAIALGACGLGTTPSMHYVKV